MNAYNLRFIRHRIFVIVLGYIRKKVKDRKRDLVYGRSFFESPDACHLMTAVFRCYSHQKRTPHKFKIQKVIKRESIHHEPE
jgi:hypothetical protein